MLYLLKTKSNKIRKIDCAARDIKKQAHFWADLDGEVTEIYTCKGLCEIQPRVFIPKNATKTEAAKIRKIGALKSELKTAEIIFYRLPKKGSYSGIYYAGEIDRIQKELDILGDKSKRTYPEVTIEVG
jgi:hypothetical protein